MAPGLVDDAATKRALVAHAGVRRDPRAVGPARRRPVRHRRPGLERGAGRRGHRARARGGGRGRRGPHRPVRPRWPVRLRRRCASGSSPSMRERSAASRSRSASRRARARSARSSARCGRASSGRSSPTSRPPRPSSRSTPSRGPAAMTTDARAGRPRARPRHDRGQGRPRRRSTAGCWGSRGPATDSSRDAAAAAPSRTRAPGGRRWSSAPSGALRAADLGRRRRDRRRRPRTDARRRSTPAARPRGRRSRCSTRGPPPRRTSSPRATGVRGWSLGGLPAALWVERHEPASPPRRAGTSRPGSGWRSG